MEEFSKLMGVSIEGFKTKAMILFEEIENRWRQLGGIEPHQKPRKGLRELHNLSSTVNYDSASKKGEGRRSQGPIISQCI
jgi:hypothetical protein